MAANAAPLVLGGMALFLLSRRGDDESATTPALTEPDPPMEFSCDELVGVWHEPVDGNLPLSMAAYEDVYAFLQGQFLESGEKPSKSALVADALEVIASGCHWEDQLQYTDRMKDVYQSVVEVHDSLAGDFIDEGEGE